MDDYPNSRFPLTPSAMEKQVSEMTDLEFVKHWIDNSAFINPILLRELRDRGLYHITNLLSGKTREERLAEATARMAHAGHYIGEPEIEEIAGHIDRIKFLRAAIYNCEPTDVVSMTKLLDDIKMHVDFVHNYFKEVQIP